jgi:hypothetical protein
MVDHMDQVLRKALVLPDPENFPKRAEPPAGETPEVPAPAFEQVTPPDAPDIVTH